jgi:hypothetical protein
MIWFFFFAAALAYAQDELTTAAKSPYDLAQYVENHRDITWGSLWPTLGVKSDDVLFGGCDHGRACSVELITVLGPRQTIVRVSQPGLAEMYLRFLETGATQWQFAGLFSPYVKYFEPRHELVKFGKKPFLLVTGQGYSGSGVSTELQSWMDLTGSDLKPVFRFTRKGYISMNGFDVSREVYANVISLETEPDERITIARGVRFIFEGSPKVLSLGMISGRSVYTRQPDGKFAFDPIHSAAPAEAEELYEHLELTHEDFLRYDIEHLKRFASGPDGPEKRWLRKFLTECENTAEKRALEALLSGKR